MKTFYIEYRVDSIKDNKYFHQNAFTMPLYHKVYTNAFQVETRKKFLIQTYWKYTYKVIGNRCYQYDFYNDVGDHIFIEKLVML